MNKIKDDVIIDALLKYATIPDAARAAGIAPSVIHSRMNDPEFRSAFIQARTDAILKKRGTVIEIPEKFMQ